MSSGNNGAKFYGNKKIVKSIGNWFTPPGTLVRSVSGSSIEGRLTDVWPEKVEYYLERVRIVGCPIGESTSLINKGDTCDREVNEGKSWIVWPDKSEYQLIENQL